MFFINEKRHSIRADCETTSNPQKAKGKLNGSKRVVDVFAQHLEKPAEFRSAAKETVGPNISAPNLGTPRQRFVITALKSVFRTRWNLLSCRVKEQSFEGVILILNEVSNVSL